MKAREKLNEIKDTWGLKTDDELAKKLGAAKETVNSWIKRDSIPEKWELKIGQMNNFRGSINNSHNNGIIVAGNSGNISVSIDRNDFKDDSADIEELISLLRYAPKSFIIKVNEKLRAFRDLAEI